MKVAILTQPLGHNYGGIMQAYALQKVLRKFTNEVVTIDYRRSGNGLLYQKLSALYRFMRFFLVNRKVPLNFQKNFHYFVSENSRFIDSEIETSERVLSKRQLAQHFEKNKYDAVIVGSDQVWRPKYSVDICSYYLDFLCNFKSIKRLAYAASFGVDNWEYSKALTRKCSKLARCFDAISVRESSAVDLCSEHLGVNASFLLDPTLLLTKDDYLTITENRAEGDKGGVFCYFLDQSIEKDDFADRVAVNLCVQKYTVQANKKIGDNSSSNLEDFKIPPIEEWLSAFLSADFVVTDSYHGCLFSIIYNKPFLVVANRQRGISRFKSILGLLGMLDRLVYDTSSFDISLKLKEEICWQNINRIIDRERQRTYDFLERNLK